MNNLNAIRFEQIKVDDLKEGLFKSSIISLVKPVEEIRVGVLKVRENSITKLQVMLQTVWCKWYNDTMINARIEMLLIETPLVAIWMLLIEETNK